MFAFLFHYILDDIWCGVEKLHGGVCWFH